MAYIFVFIALLAIELTYFRIADYFNIIDKPNQRSSHHKTVLRGGGIIFTISLLLFFLTHQFTYPWFMAGLVIIAGISFADDIKTLPSWFRFSFHCISAALMLLQLIAIGFHGLNILIEAIAVVSILGIINAYNFMDGINGITTGYSFTVLAALFYLNYDLKIIDNDAIIYLATGNLVFFIFNFRKNARCFAGDVGSIAMAFALLFFTAGLMLKTASPIFILLFAVYIVDAGLTIVYRLLKKENIFIAHRQHLYQTLANEKQWPQLLVSTAYSALQAVINLGVCLFWQKNMLFQYIFISSVLALLALLYIFCKRSFLLNE